MNEMKLLPEAKVAMEVLGELREAKAEIQRLEAEVGRLQTLDESVKRAYKLVLDRGGSVQVVPIDELLKARLDMIKEMEAHHQEHHDREHESEAKYKAVVKRAVDLIGGRLREAPDGRSDLRVPGVL